MRIRGGFTLIEMLVVIAIIALLISVLFPVLGQARSAAQQAACLANMYALGQAHTAFIADNQGAVIDATHDGDVGRVSWIETLRGYNTTLLLRSPVDTSPHFTGGTPINGKFRKTSYAINYQTSPRANTIKRVQQVPRPSVTVEFLIKVFEVADDPTSLKPLNDHVHTEAWGGSFLIPPAARAGADTQINAHGGDLGTDGALSVYGYLDGHAEINRFADIFTNLQTNRVDPTVAR
ncbi:MAG: type II secretion system protein [Planctomycetota bacterium]